MHQLKLKNSALLLFSYVVRQLFPKAELCSKSPTQYGFLYDVIFPFPITAAVLVQIEEKMREVARSGEQIYELEMAPNAAFAYLSSCGNQRAIEQIEERAPYSANGTLFCANLAGFGDLLYPCQSDLKKDFYIQFYAQEEIKTADGTVLRLSCAVFESPVLLKDFLKVQKKRAAKLGHEGIVKELNLLKETESFNWGYLPKGVLVKNILEQLINQLQKGYAPVLVPGKGDRLRGLASLLSKECPAVSQLVPLVDREERRCFEGLFSTETIWRPIALSRCLEEDILEKSISSLQLIVQFLKILDLSFRVVYSPSLNKRVLAGLKQLSHEQGIDLSETVQIDRLQVDKDSLLQVPLVEFFVADRYGREWVGPYFSVGPLDKKRSGMGAEWAVMHSLFFSIERLIALLLEQKGRLPFFLAPEQVRVVLVDEAASLFANEIREELQKRGVRTQLVAVEKDAKGLFATGLKKQLFSAVKEGVYLLICLGKRETELKVLNVRFLKAQDEQEEEGSTQSELQMDFNSLLARIDDVKSKIG